MMKKTAQLQSKSSLFDPERQYMDYAVTTRSLRGQNTVTITTRSLRGHYAKHVIRALNETGFIMHVNPRSA